MQASMNKMKGRKIFIGGIQGSGKTQAAKYLVRKCFKRGIMLRFTPDFDDVDNVDRVAREGDPVEQMRAIARFLIREGEAFMEKGVKPTYDVWVIDEADLIMRSGLLQLDEMHDIVAMHRHYGIAVIFVTRRPQDIPAKIVESCQFQLYFPIEGKNVRSHVASVDDRIITEMDKISYGDYRFIFKEIGKEPVIHKKLPL